MFDHDGMLAGGGMMWLLWLVLIIVIVVIVRSFFTSAKSADHSANDSPLTILEQRYARGEIDEEEFQHRRKLLQN